MNNEKNRTLTIYTYQPQNLIDKINANGFVFVEFKETNLYKQTQAGTGSPLYHDAYMWMAGKLSQKTGVWMKDVYGEGLDIPTDDDGDYIDEEGQKHEEISEAPEDYTDHFIALLLRIIEPETFDRVQDMIKERASRKGYSGVTIFSSKIECGCCGGWYGPKVWHSTDRYRKVIWQCNAKFKGKTGCATPHLTEEEIKAAFVKAVNKVITDREKILSELKSMRNMFTGTQELEKEQKQLAEQMNVDADAVQELIAENAWVAQDQEEYRVKYDALVSRFEETKKKYEEVSGEIVSQGIRRREFGRFIKKVEGLPGAVEDLDEALWGSLVEKATVNSREDIVFTMCSGMEVDERASSSAPGKVHIGDVPDSGKERYCADQRTDRSGLDEAVYELVLHEMADRRSCGIFTAGDGADALKCRIPEDKEQADHAIHVCVRGKEVST